MEFSTGQPLAEYNRIYKETDQLYHGLALRMAWPTANWSSFTPSPSLATAAFSGTLWATPA